MKELGKIEIAWNDSAMIPYEEKRRILDAIKDALGKCDTALALVEVSTNRYGEVARIVKKY